MICARLLDNFSGRIGDEVLNYLASSKAVMMAVAFVRSSGVELIERNLLELLERGGKAEMILGLDFSFTEPSALRRFLAIQTVHPNFKTFAFSNPYSPGQETVFHPKLYLFERVDSEWTVLVGSSNLSRGGLMNNVEVGVALDGPATNPVIAAALSFYARVRGRESVFAPTDDYLDAYEEVRSVVEGGRIRKAESKAVQEAVARLRQLEGRLPGTVPTQKELIVQAIKNLRTDRDSWVHWSKIAKFVETRAREMGIEYKWDTLHNSVRGRLNEHTVGKGGEDLFLRKGGVSGRFGLYRLSDAGETCEAREIVG